MSPRDLQTGSGHFGEGSKDLVKGVVGGAASSASKMTDALDHFVRGAGALDSTAQSSGTGGMESSKVTKSDVCACRCVLS